MKKKTKTLIISMFIFALIISIGAYNVLAGIKFEVKIEANDNVVNETGEEITFTVSSSDLVETGLASGQFYIEYDSNIFSVKDDGIKYLQYESNFSDSVSTKPDGTGKITVLYYDNSDELNQSLVAGDLFTITLVVDNMSIIDKVTVKITGEGFSTIQSEKIVDIEGEFNNEEITFRERNIFVNNLTRSTLNEDFEKPIYNGESTSLLLNVISSDIIQNSSTDVFITRSYKYGDINIDGLIDEKDLEILRKYLVDSEGTQPSFSLSDTQLILADIDNDGIVTARDSLILGRYISGWQIDSKLGQIHEDISEIYYYGDIDLNGVVDENDGILATQNSTFPDVYPLTPLQISLLPDDSKNNAIDYNALLIDKFLDNTPINNIGRTIDNTNHLYGDVYLDGVINYKDVQLLEKHFASSTTALNPYRLSNVQKTVADIDKSGVVDRQDLEYLIEYYTLANGTNYSKIGTISNKSDLFHYGDLNNDKIISYKDYEILSSGELEDWQIELSNFSLNQEYTNLEILKKYLEEINYETHRIGLIYNPNDNNINKYGDLNLDGRITQEDVNLVITYEDLKGQASLNMLPIPYTTAAMVTDLYAKDLTDEEIIEYFTFSMNRIGTKTEDNNIIGDVNSDGKSNPLDRMILMKYLHPNFDRELDETQLRLADIDNDGIVSIDDFYILMFDLSGWEPTSLFNHYKENVHYINTATPEFVNDKFNINEIKFNGESIEAQNINLETKNTIETGVYNIYLSSSNEDKTIMSNIYQFSVEPKPVSEINFEKEEYVVGVNQTKRTNNTVLPENAYNKNVYFSVKDTNIATVDKYGVITGVEPGETYLYANSTDGNTIQGATKIVVVQKNISLSNLSTECTNDECKQEIYDKIGGVKTMDIELQNIESTNLEYLLVKTDDNNQTNLKDQVEINFYPGNTNKIEIEIGSYDLEPGSYIFKVIGDDTIVSNIINFEILEYIPVTSIDITYNNNSTSSLTMIKGDTIELSSVLNKHATNQNVVWGYNNLNVRLNDNKILSPTLTAVDISEGKLYVYSEDNNDIRKEISVKIIEPTSEVQTQTITSNIGNDTIDIKYGGTYHNTIEFNNAKNNSKVDIIIKGENNEIISESYYTLENDITIKNGIANIDINILPNAFPNSGEFLVEYTYEVDDSKHTKKTGTFKIHPQAFVPITSIETENDSITLIKGKSTTIKYNIETAESTYKKIEFNTNNAKISVDNNGKITALEAGTATVTLQTKDDSGISKTINIEVIDYDLASDEFIVNPNDNIIRKVKDKLTYNLLIGNMTEHNKITTKAFKNNTQISNTALIGTGTVLKTYLNDKLFNEYTMVVSGDLNGDGKILANDILTTKMHILQKSTLETIYFEAGDINSDQNVNARDVLSMQMYILEKTNNVWGE